MAAYVLSVDQSTQGTKSLLFGSNGELLARADLPHRQMVSDMGWVSHDPNEIYENVLKTVEMVCQKASIQPDDIVCMGMSNQRETSIAWDRQSGKPVCDAIVWQCARAAALCAGIEKSAWERPFEAAPASLFPLIFRRQSWRGCCSISRRRQR